jgi:hypothetical protein
VGLHRNGTRKGPKKTLDTETETGWHSSKDQGWLDSCGVEGWETCPSWRTYTNHPDKAFFAKNTLEPAIVSDYNCHMGYIDKADRMASSYMATHQTWKWTKKLFFHLLDLAILNSYILLSSCVGNKNLTYRFLTGPWWHGLVISHNHPGL